MKDCLDQERSQAFQSLQTTGSDGEYADRLCQKLLALSAAERAQVQSAGHCGRITPLAEALREAASLADFSRRHDEQNPQVQTRVEAKALIVAYPRCYCPLVAGHRLAHPKLWCQCTVGYVKEIYGFILGRTIEPVLRKSIKQGDPLCEIAIPDLFPT